MRFVKKFSILKHLNLNLNNIHLISISQKVYKHMANKMDDNSTCIASPKGLLIILKASRCFYL